MKLYQPVYLNRFTDRVESTSQAVFTTKEEAQRFAKFVCNKACEIEIIELEVVN